MFIYKLYQNIYNQMSKVFSQKSEEEYYKELANLLENKKLQKTLDEDTKSYILELIKQLSDNKFCALVDFIAGYHKYLIFIEFGIFFHIIKKYHNINHKKTSKLIKYYICGNPELKYLKLKSIIDYAEEIGIIKSLNSYSYVWVISNYLAGPNINDNNDDYDDDRGATILHPLLSLGMHHDDSDERMKLLIESGFNLIINCRGSHICYIILRNNKKYINPRDVNIESRYSRFKTLIKCIKDFDFHDYLINFKYDYPKNHSIIPILLELAINAGFEFANIVINNMEKLGEKLEFDKNYNFLKFMVENNYNSEHITYIMNILCEIYGEYNIDKYKEVLVPVELSTIDYQQDLTLSQYALISNKNIELAQYLEDELDIELTSNIKTFDIIRFDTFQEIEYLQYYLDRNFNEKYKSYNNDDNPFDLNTNNLYMFSKNIINANNICNKEYMKLVMNNFSFPSGIMNLLINNLCDNTTGNEMNLFNDKVNEMISISEEIRETNQKLDKLKKIYNLSQKELLRDYYDS